MTTTETTDTTATGTGTTTSDPAGTPTGGQDDPGGDAAKARREAAELRRRLKQTEAALAKHEEAGKTELEKAAGRADAAEAEAARLRDSVRDLSLTNTIRAEAQSLGVVSPEAAARLIDRAVVEWGDDQQPSRDSVTKALKALVKEFPFLTAAGDIDHQASSSQDRGGSTGDRVNALIRGGR